MSTDYINRILKARVYDVARETSLDRMRRLSRRLENQILLKREDTQPVFSFKLRGAYNKIASLPIGQLEKGVITASAGNHAQGVALAGSRLKIPTLIVVPKTAPRIKVEAIRAFGAEVELHGNTYDEAYQHARALADKNGMSFVHPYDDPDVIAGQGTIAQEIMRQCKQGADAIFVPVGGGGLIAGIVAYIKPLYPHVKVIGVEPDDAPCMYEALRTGQRIVLERVGIFADGVAVRQVGEETFRVCRDQVDEVLLVSTDEICAAIKDIFDDTRAIAEPAGALAVAGMKKYIEREQLKGATLVAINSGANMNFDRLRHVAERAELGEQREILIATTIDERPGSFRKFCEIIGARSITEFNYRFADPDRAHVFAGVEMQHGESEKKLLLEKLAKHGYPVVDMSDNEMAKLHVRYMVGGHTHGKVADERLYRFIFPERPGALMHFLMSIGGRWNISLFHYRNHGADYGRVLVGIQVPADDSQAFDDFLNGLGFPNWPETDNPVYQLFLS